MAARLPTEPDVLFVPPRWVELEQLDAKASNPSLYNFGRRAKLGRRVRERSVCESHGRNANSMSFRNIFAIGVRVARVKYRVHPRR